jgi:uncharacterized membrane protein YhaH (DUF805 family)
VLVLTFDRNEAGRGRQHEFHTGHQLWIQNYVGFSARAARSEYWFWTLFGSCLDRSDLIDLALFEADFSPLSTIASLGLLLPSLAVGVRRLHDLDRTGWWLLLIITVIGSILLLVWFCMRGTAGPNRFGPDPLAGTA